jgi:hypothetical protein
MRAKQVNEFKQGGDPYEIMGLGYPAKIKAWFEKWFPGINYSITNDMVIASKTLWLPNETDFDWLPDNFYINGNLNISATGITKIPKNFNVHGYCDISWCDVTTLPNDMTIIGDLNLDATKITELPNEIKEIYHICLGTLQGKIDPKHYDIIESW